MFAGFRPEQTKQQDADRLIVCLLPGQRLYVNTRITHLFRIALSSQI